jgi:hypothetical protein
VKQTLQQILQFDPTTHTYTLDGYVLPSVTQVLSILQTADFSSVPKEVMEAAGRRGTAVHALLENDDATPLIVESAKKQRTALHSSDWKAAARQKLEQRMGQNLDGYVDAARRFLCDSGFSTTVCEQLAYHPVYEYAGRFDRAGTIRNGNVAIVDWKTGIITPTVRLQLAAYANLLKDPRKYRRLAVKLNCNGTYKVHEYPSSETARDFQVFLAALACYRWRKQYN